MAFTPLLPGIIPHAEPPEGTPIALPEARRPANLSELAFAEIPTLAALVKSRQVSCVELAELSLARLRELDPTLHFVVSTCEERALSRARALDAELAEGKWRGPLHGIPYGAKDLFSVRGTRTTWGAKPFEQQEIDVDATVIRKLDEAGAVLVAKLTLGALAMGDVWFGGKTRNPWDPERGSSGSSAGSASAVAAGCVPFALGTETLGSITSPSARCGNSSIRPTFGNIDPLCFCDRDSGFGSLDKQELKIVREAPDPSRNGELVHALGGPLDQISLCEEIPFLLRSVFLTDFLLR